MPKPAPPGSRSDPFSTFQFAVKIGTRNGTQVVGGFSDVSGLMAETDVETIKVGGINDHEVILPGPSKWAARLSLKRGLGDQAMLWAWYRETLRGAIKREQVTILVRRPDGSPGLSFTFVDACPVKWTGPELNATGSAVAFETIELIHRGYLPDPDQAGS